MLENILMIISFILILVYDLLPVKYRNKLGIMGNITLIVVILFTLGYGIYQLVNYDTYFYIILSVFFALPSIVCLFIDKSYNKYYDYVTDSSVSPKVRRTREIVIGILILIVCLIILMFLYFDEIYYLFMQ